MRAPVSRVPVLIPSIDGLEPYILKGRAEDVIANQERLPLLSAALVFPGYLAYAVEISAEEAAGIIKAAVRKGKRVESYVGHPATARIVSELAGVEIPARRAEYTPAEGRGVFSGELALVVRLRRRPAKPGDYQVTLDDLQFLAVYYVKIRAVEVS